MGVSVGIDVSKQHLDWAASGGKANAARVPNTPAGIRRLVARLGEERDIVRIVVESTGGYERALTVALSTARLPMILVNPWRV